MIQGLDKWRLPMSVAEAAEAKFKEVMVSYEAIKQERKDMKSWSC